MIEFYPPTSLAEWIEVIAAGITILAGILMLVAARYFVSTPSEIFVLRGHLGGLVLGLGLAALLLQQPLIYLTLGISWGFSALGQIWSALVDRKLSTKNIFLLILKIGLTILPVLAVLGYFG